MLQSLRSKLRAMRARRTPDVLDVLADVEASELGERAATSA